VKALEDVMIKYDSTVRNSQDQILQFIYGEDGMSGENIEDLTIELIKMDDAQMKSKFDLLKPDERVETQLRKNF
jgi:DNA-directed RNA polymerase II subunit RPB1